MGQTLQSLARTRIQGLLDENSFVEIGKKITARNTDFNLDEKRMPTDGVITGYGLVDGNLVYVYSQDVSVLGGTVGEMHAKKIINLYDLAMKMGAPIIGFLDCGGVRLQEATDALHAFGEIFTKQALASGVILQIAAVFGVCGGGAAVIPALADFVFMEQKNGQIFVNTPNALEGNRTEICNTSGAEFQSKEAGMADVTGTQEEILGKMRQILSMFPANNKDGISYAPCTDDLNRACQELQQGANAVDVVSQIADDRSFMEMKADYASDMATGFVKLNGGVVGCVANREQEISANGAKKAADFVSLCDAFQVPVLTVTDATGFKALVEDEKYMAKSVASCIRGFADATVPKVNVVTGKAYGTAYVAMNSKSTGADMVYAWPNAEIGMMDANMAAKIMYQEADAKELKEKAAQYEELQSGIESAAARGYVDTVIEPADTRKYVIGAFEMLYTKKEERVYKKHYTVS